MKSAQIAAIVLAFCVAAASSARADEAAVNKYVAEATELVGKGSQFFSDASAKLDLADASMDDVPDAQKPALKAKIDAVKAQIQSAAGAEDKAKIERQLSGLLEDVEGAVGNLATWPGKSEELTTLLNDPKTTAAIGEPAVTAAKKKFATFAKVNAAKALPQNLATAKQAVDDLTKDWTEQKADIAANGINPNARDRVKDDLDQMGRFFKDLPADNADVKSLQAEIARVKSEKAAADTGAGTAEAVRRMDSYFDLYKNEFDGMDAETAAPTWADFKAGNEPAHSLGAPKTIAYYSRVKDWLASFDKNEDYAAVKDQPAVKAKISEVQAKVVAAHDRIKKYSEGLVAGLEAEKINANNANAASLLHDEIRNALGENTDEAKTLMARVDKLQDDFKNAGAKADADKDAYYKSLTEQANKAWPAMMAKFDVSDGFDPNNASALKGKYVKFVGNNLIGWRYKTGDFDYATTVNGLPVAGRYDPAVKAAIKEVEAKLGRQIGDNDDDGEWTVIARVEGGTGQLTKMEHRTGDVTVDGTKVGTIEGTVDRPMDAPIVTVVAVKAGPVAAAAGQGVVKEDGTIAAATGATGSTAGGRGMGSRLIGMISGLLAVVVGAACLLKSKFAPLAGNANAVQIADRVGSQNLAYAGLAAIVLGVIGVLLNLVALPGSFLHAVIGLLASAAMIVAGIVVSREFLESRGALPASVTAPLAQFAVPAGLACALLGVLTVLTSLF